MFPHLPHVILISLQSFMTNGIQKHKKPVKINRNKLQRNTFNPSTKVILYPPRKEHAPQGTLH